MHFLYYALATLSQKCWCIACSVKKTLFQAVKVNERKHLSSAKEKTRNIYILTLLRHNLF